jgi:phage terminase Nu1 subunit (DNA packaging protein)
VTLALELPDELLDALVERVYERLRPRYVTREKLAERYGVAERTIRTWREKGMPGAKVGKVVMYSVEACDRWIEREGS